MAYALGTLLLIVLDPAGVPRLHGDASPCSIGLVVGTLVAWVLGDAHFDAVAASAWLGVTTPFYFGWPKFAFAAIISMIVVMLITAVETTGDVFATGEIVEKRIGKDDIARALRADGLATTIGGVLNSFPYTCFAENVGLVRLTRVKSRYVVAAAGVIMIILGLLPKAAAIVAGIPHPVLGGAALAMFATVAVVGIQTLTRVDFHDHRNVVIVAPAWALPCTSPRSPTSPRPCRTGRRSSSAAASRWAASPRSCSTWCSTTSARAAGRPWPARPGATSAWTRSTRCPREEFVATFSRPVPGPGLGGRAGLRPAPLLRHPGPAPRVPGSAVRGDRRGAGAADQAPTRTWARDVSDGASARGSSRPSARAEPPRREGARGAGLAHRRPTATASASRW